MSSRRKAPRRYGWRRDEPRVTADGLALILDRAPDVPGYGGGKWAIYAVRCCWWTSRPDDGGRTLSGLPCCPHCGSPLMMAPLEKFVRSAREAAIDGHYGPDGIAAFTAAHNAPCHPSWDGYRAAEAAS